MIVDGWLASAERLASPNADERPGGEAPSLLVVHNISLPPGEFGGDAIKAFFTNCLDCTQHPFYREIEQLRVSTHLLIERSGHTTQFVPFTRRAWHAGVSSFQGRERCNDFSIGIEMEGADTVPYTDRQYRVLADVTLILMRAYPGLSPERIVGHSDIAPGRKTDPGPAFDWVRYRRSLVAEENR